MCVEFTIPLKPCIKKNSQQIIFNKKLKRYMIIQGPKYLQYEKDCKDYVPDLHIDYPINVKAIFYMPSRRRVDLNNLFEALHDVMTKYGCVDDDNCNIIYSVDGSCVKYDKDNPRTEVEITKLEDVITLKDM